MPQKVYYHVPYGAVKPNDIEVCRGWALEYPEEGHAVLTGPDEKIQTVSARVFTEKADALHFLLNSLEEAHEIEEKRYLERCKRIQKALSKYQ